MDDETKYGPIYHYSTGQAITDGVLAPYRVVCLMVRSRAVWEAERAHRANSADRELHRRYRVARLTAIQAAVLEYTARERISMAMSFHHRVWEARLCAVSMRDTAALMARADPRVNAPGLWATYVHGGQPLEARVERLVAFGKAHVDGGALFERRFLCSARAIGEGTDVPGCQASIWWDARGSSVDLVQTAGRSLRMQPGEGKTAYLIVPALLGPNEGPEDLLTSRAFSDLVTVLTALRSHDHRLVEQLATPQVASTSVVFAIAEEDEKPAWQVAADLRARKAGEQTTGDQDTDEQGAGDQDAEAGGAEAGRKAGKVSDQEAERGLELDEQELERALQEAADKALRAQVVPMDARSLADFVSTRIFDTEAMWWIRGLRAAERWQEAHGDLDVPVEALGEDGYAVGGFIDRARQLCARGELTEEQIGQLDDLGMIWSVPDEAWRLLKEHADTRLALHGNLAVPTTGPDSVVNGYRLGLALRNERHADAQGELSPARKAYWDGKDPYWNPAWGIRWQRELGVAVRAVAAVGGLSHLRREPFEGLDVLAWLAAQHRRWHQLQAEQRTLMEGHGLAPTAPVVAPRTRADQRQDILDALDQHLAAGRTLPVPRDAEPVALPNGQSVNLRTALNNARARWVTLPEQYRADLEARGVRPRAAAAQAAE
jgi:hypothetical protein